MPISKTIQIIVEQTKDLGRRHNAKINQQRRTTPQILNGAAFAVVKRKLTHYTLKLSIRKWSATNKIADDIKEGREEEFYFNEDKGCTFNCKLPARFGLPCRHWMYASMV